MPAPTSSCPICRKGVRPRSENPFFPFCSSRCKQVDLGKWLDEAYRLPVEDASGEEGLREDPLEEKHS
jgi:endogenous inhibitor of DNA gyrase (YacG/DUF329 family)